MHEVTFATSAMDKLKVYRLRYRAFRDHIKTGFFLDRNEYDKGAKHLVVKYKGKIVGTYRIREDGFYSETMFDLKDFLSLPGKKIEVSRACIDPGHGNRTSLRILWDGLLDHMREEDVDYLFSVVSIFTSCPHEMAAVWNLLQEKNRILEIVRPLRTLEFIGLKPAKTHIAKRLLTPILRGYFRLGGKVYGRPAFDQCYGVLVVLKIKDIKYERREG